MIKPTIAIHAGAGLFHLDHENQTQVKQHLAQLKQIVEENYRALIAGVGALNVVEQAVVALENYEDFNAGRGSVLNSAGIVEMDAAIMDGKNRQAGAIAAVRSVKNPISGARAVMEYSKHVLIVGSGAEEFCSQHRVPLQDPAYFITEYRLKQLMKVQSLGHVADLESLGTVGAVARDIHGHLAAATSTGGKTNKLPGRVGDSPIIGAGTWADDETCAISGTGDGEIFIRSAFAHQIHSLIQHKKVDLKSACQQAFFQLEKLGGEGGCIAIDRTGQMVLMFNTTGMYRGWVEDDGKIYSAIT